MIRTFLLALALGSPAAALDVPYLSGRVNDHAGLLSPAARETIEVKLKDFETRTGHQVAVLTLDSLDGASLEDFSLKVARTWQLGRKGINDGVLFLISKNDRKLRIEVGHGLEGELPDALAGRIIQVEVAPRFRAGNFEGGVTAGVDAIVAAAEGLYSPPTMNDMRRRLRENQDDFSGAPLNIIEKILMSAFVFGILGLFEFVGVTIPGAGWFLYFFLIPFWAAFPMAIWGVKIGMGFLMTHLIGFPLIKTFLPYTALGQSLAKRVVYRRSGSFTTGGGWSSGGGSSGSSFSGGGGSFGGGGSSGSW